MTKEELQAKISTVKSMEDAYALAKEAGFIGTYEEYDAACAEAANQMDLDAMENVAGGFGLEDIKNGAVTVYDYVKDGLVTAWDYTSGAAVATYNWAKDHPAETAGIIGSAVLIGAAVKKLASAPSNLTIRPSQNHLMDASFADPQAEADSNLLNAFQ